MVPTLHTERLVLRPLRSSDAPSIQHHFGRWEIIRHLSSQVPWPYPPDGAAAFIASVLEQPDRLIWVIARREEPREAIGQVDVTLPAAGRAGGFDPPPAGHRGFWLSVDWQGMGYMTEAVTAVQDHLFFDLGIERIVVCNSIDNARSRRVKEKTGAVLIGTTTLPHHHGSTVTQQWEVTRPHWARLRGRSLPAPEPDEPGSSGPR